MNLKSTLSFFALAATLTGCATKDLSRTMLIDSKPQGARVFVGFGAKEEDADKSRQYLGVTPLKWTTKGDDQGRWHLDGAFLYSMFVTPCAVFTAEADGTNVFSRRQVFHAGSFAAAPDRIPEGIFFDLTKPEPAAK